MPFTQFIKYFFADNIAIAYSLAVWLAFMAINYYNIWFMYQLPVCLPVQQHIPSVKITNKSISKAARLLLWFSLFSQNEIFLHLTAKYSSILVSDPTVWSFLIYLFFSLSFSFKNNKFMDWDWIPWFDDFVFVRRWA